MLSRVVLYAFLTAFLCSYPARAQEVVTNLDATDAPSSPGIFRTLDDSDPEMRKLAERHFARGPCGKGPGQDCFHDGDLHSHLRADGNRMARYLIAQYEATLAEGYIGTQHLVSAICGTQSPVGHAYIRQMIRQPKTWKERDEALYALPHCQSNEAMDEALHVWRTDPDEQNRGLAMRAMGFNLTKVPGRADVLAVLDAERRRGEGNPAQIADKMLRRYERHRAQGSRP